ncbi:leucine-rich repeat domain-containing protein [Lactobacillus sp. B3795]|uniref:leucine-rich repeat domain-containing protein n=1 Tax=Lactobacillus sp. B3795 TaxID=2818036 RepID=UPI00265CC71E|nr:leucine-rich repeat domain-containing protein [Lactobacillus sp. B3795]MCX8742401.1 leucine-rich repeat domain-containing protein [Lactobacillus sp. B3795]
MKKLAKKAIILSTLTFGALEVTSIANKNFNPNDNVIAYAAETQDHFDASTMFPDKTLQDIIVQSVNRYVRNSYGAVKSINDVTQSDINKLTTLDGSNEQTPIASLTGIENLTNLTTVKLNNVKFDPQINFSPLKNLPNLTSLSVQSSNINSQMINNLDGWNNTKLTSINLSNNQIDSIDFMKHIDIPNIQSIIVDSNKISDFSPLAGKDWEQLKTLSASHNQISDISPIASITWPNLQSLDASFNNISDISSIAKVKWDNIQEINVSNNHIKDINVISSADFPNIIQITADNNEISDINSFAHTNWKQLNQISVNGNHIKDISAMKGLSTLYPNLQTFMVDNNQLSDLSFMAGYQIGGGSALNQAVNETYTLNKPKVGDVIKIPINLDDINTSPEYATADTNRNQLVITLQSAGFTAYGTDGNVYSSPDGYSSNGISYLAYKYNGGDLPTMATLAFRSTLGQNSEQPYYTGIYNVALNYKSDDTTSNASSSASSAQSSASSQANSSSVQSSASSS